MTFLENYDRYESQTFKVDYLCWDLSIGIEPPNINFHQGKMVCPIFKHVEIRFNV